MRRALWMSIALIFVWPCSVWSATQPLELKVKDDVLLAKAMDGGLSLTLPEFFVFTRSGAAIFHDKGFNSTFMDAVERAMHSSTPIRHSCLELLCRRTNDRIQRVLKSRNS